jgi:hypothetical protein
MNHQKRLARLEHTAALAAIEYQKRFEDAQAMLGLPLPAGADIQEGLRRLQSCLQRCKEVTADGRDLILGEFRTWVQSEHERCKNG